jgi:hypothetical protein
MRMNMICSERSKTRPADRDFAAAAAMFAIGI